jgi:clan AA aspartic protease (TIGR02281 family)
MGRFIIGSGTRETSTICVSDRAQRGDVDRISLGAVVRLGPMDQMTYDPVGLINTSIAAVVATGVATLLWAIIARGRLFLLLLLAATMRPAAGETIQLEHNRHGTYTISVQINRALVLPFVLDTGASLMVIPEDVFRTLTRTGTVTKNDFIGTGTAMLADGSEHASDSYVLHEVRVGDHIVRNVVASVVPVNGPALLGQSFLSKLPAWSIDNTRQALVIAAGAGATAWARLPETGRANRSVSRKPIPRSPSVGRGAIASRDPPSSIQTTRAVG